MRVEKVADRVAEWKPIVKEYETSGLSMSQFARLHGIDRDKLKYWRKKMPAYCQRLRAHAAAKESNPDDAHVPQVTIEYGELKVRFSGPIDSQVLTAVMAIIASVKSAERG